MGAELIAALLIAGLLIGSTDTGREGAKAFWKSATAPPKKAGGKSGKKSSARGRGKLGKRAGAKVGGWAGRQTRVGTAALGRAGGKGAAALGRASKRAGAKAGGKAQARWDQRTIHGYAKPVSRPGSSPGTWTAKCDTEDREIGNYDTWEQAQNAASRHARRASPDPDGPNEPTSGPAASTPQPTSKESTMVAAEIDPPQTDEQLLEGFHQLTRQFQAEAESLEEQFGQQFRQIAEALQEHASQLMHLHLPSSVTSEVHAAAETVAASAQHILQAAEGLGEGAQHIVKAAQAFQAHFEEPIDIARRGFKFTGEAA